MKRAHFSTSTEVAFDAVFRKKCSKKHKYGWHKMALDGFGTDNSLTLPYLKHSHIFDVTNCHRIDSCNVLIVITSLNFPILVFPSVLAL